MSLEPPIALDLPGVTLSNAGITHFIAELSERNVRMMRLQGAEPVRLSPGTPPVFVADAPSGISRRSSAPEVAAAGACLAPVAVGSARIHGGSVQMNSRGHVEAELFPSRSHAARPPPPCRDETDSAEPAPLVGRTVADVECELILETLRHCSGNRTHAARILGISIRTLRNKLHEYAGDGMVIPEAHRPAR
jgi:hypothetical protein